MGKHSKYKKARKLKAHVASAEEKECFEDIRRREIDRQLHRKMFRAAAAGNPKYASQIKRKVKTESGFDPDRSGMGVDPFQL